MNEYIIVVFYEIREVIINSDASGYMTNQVIEHEPGTHTLSLAGKTDFTPLKQDVTPVGTSPLAPLTVKFLKG